MNMQEAAGAALAVCDRMSTRVEALRRDLVSITEDHAPRRSVLVIEDDPMQREWLWEVLSEQLEVPVTAVATAEAARLAWARGRHGAILADLHLPGESGARFVSALPRGPRVAIYTGAGDDLSDELKDALRAIQARLIEKPSNPDRIVAILRELLDDAAPVVM